MTSKSSITDTPSPDKGATKPNGADDGIDLDSFASDEPTITGTESVDMAQFMVDDDEVELLGGEQPWDEVPVIKPRKTHVIMVHPDPELRIQLLSYEDDEGMEKGYYLVTPSAGQYIAELVVPILYVPYVTPKGTVKLWPLKVRRDTKGDLNKWSRSGINLANKYAGRWIRVIPDEGFYRAQLMKMNHEPAWPAELSKQALIDRAFADKLITDKKHPIVQHMIGG